MLYDGVVSCARWSVVNMLEFGSPVSTHKDQFPFPCHYNVRSEDASQRLPLNGHKPLASVLAMPCWITIYSKYENKVLNPQILQL